MPRKPRLVVPGLAHHVTQRGNNRQDVFLDDMDRSKYLELLRRESQAHNLKILGYCLMSNHLHLLVVPGDAPSLAKAVGQCHFRYTQHYNSRRGITGHLWQNRFFSCPVEDNRISGVLRYIEQNPVRAGLESAPWEYPWSSASVHCGQSSDVVELDLGIWSQSWDEVSWRSWIAGNAFEADLKEIREAVHHGRPLGSPQFLSQLEDQFGFNLRPTKRGHGIDP